MPKKSLVTAAVVALAVSTVVLAADESGAEIYALMCVSCHGKDGAGKTQAGQRFGLKDLGSREVQEQSDSELYEAIATGKNTSGKEYPHAFLARGLTKAEVKNVVAYVRTLKKNKR